MSHAFVKEDEPQWLNEIAPTMRSLLAYLSNEHGGRAMHEKRSYINSETGNEFHEMSDGLTYFVNVNGRWEIVED